MTTIRQDELQQAIGLVTNLRAAIEFRTYHSDAVPMLSDTLADWLVEAERELAQASAKPLIEPAHLRGM